MRLFTGDWFLSTHCGTLQPGAWYGSAGGCYQEPHLVWFEDRSWCLACDVDEEIEFSVGCSADVVDALSKALPGAALRVLYGESAPLFRERA